MKEYIKSLPRSPGVYLMKDSASKVIYVGKAKSLRDRVMSYFSGAPSDPKTAKMAAEVRSIEHIVTDSELEAIFLEARLIKDIKPKYNIELKDDKSFPVAVVTDYDDFPKVWIVHQTDEVKGIRFGPFTGAVDLRRAIKVLQKIFKFATCQLTIKEEDKKRRYFRPCLLHYIGQCSAPCAGAITKDEYAKTIAGLLTFLRGDKDGLISRLSAEMEKSAHALDFERAAILRDQISALRSTGELFSRYSTVNEIGPMSPLEANRELNKLMGTGDAIRIVDAVDISHISGAWSVGSVVRFVDGIPSKSGYRRYRIKTVRGIDDYGMICEVVSRRLARLVKEGGLPDLLLIDGGEGQLSAARKAMDSLILPKKVFLAALAKREEALFTAESGRLDADHGNLGLRLLMYARDEAHRFAKNYHLKLRRKSMI